MESILDDGNIDIDDVTIFQAFISRDSMTDDMINAGTNRLWKAIVVKWSRN